MHPLIKKHLLFFLALAALALVWSCNTSSSETDQYLTWNLSDAYKAYDTVSIKLVDAQDSSLVYEVVWNAPIPDPAHFPKYKLTAAKDKDFTIQIRCYNAKHELLLSKEVKVVGTKPQTTVVLQPDVRLLALSVSPGTLAPVFDPNLGAYTAQVGEDVSSITLTATPVDAANILTLDQTLSAWGLGNSVKLDSGANVVEMTVATKDGKVSKNYELVVTRGRVIPPEEIVSVTLQDKSLTLFTGDGPTAQKATVVPAGALLQWTSQDENVVRVDGKGNLSPVGPGMAKVMVKAGDHTDEVDVTVKRDVPVIDPGPNQGVKIGGEVTFNISLSQEHGTFVSFKYSLDGDTAWDNLSDTTHAPATLMLKHTYPTAGFFTAYFYLKDSEGNVATASCTIHVSDAAVLVNFLSPGKDTLVNSTPITIKYDVNGNVHTETRDLKEGVNVVSVDSGDGASVKVTLDTQPPKAPNVTAATPTANPKPTWTWTSGGGGNGTFRARLDTADLSAAPSIAVLTYTSAAVLSVGDHILYVQERDDAGNWSASGKFTVTVLALNVTPPNPPLVTGTSPTNGPPKWTWSTGGGGGSGTYRYKLGDSSLAGATDTKELSYTLTAAPVSGTTYKLYVAETDSAGNWSRSTGYAILFDLTKPSVAIVTPQASGTYLTTGATVAFSGTASGPNPIVKVSYKINNVAAADAVFDKGNWTIASVPTVEGTVTLVTVIATDNLGNTGESTLSLLRDNTPPSAPALSASPATPTNAAKGTWTWTAGADGSGGSGLNGKYRYALNGAAFTTISATTIADLALTEGDNAFAVQEQDLAGNWSASATNTVKSDRTGPAVAITSPASPATLGTIHVTLSGTVSDAGSGVLSVNVSGQVSGNGAATVTGNAWTTGDLILKSGANALVATATDKVGNTGTANFSATVTVATPVVAITSPANNAITNKDTLTVKYTVDGGAVNSQQFSLTEGTNTLTVTSPPNPVGVTGTKSITVIKDATAPNFPTVTVLKTPTKDTPSWTFGAGSDNAGGSGVASIWEYQLSGASTATGTLTTASFSLPGAGEGTYNFTVRQQDKAGNWSAYSSLAAIVVDKTAPVVSVTLPATGYVTAQANVALTCKYGGVDQTPVAYPLATGQNTVTCQQTDAAGNTGSASVTVYSVPNTIFVKPGGTGTGFSWDNAVGDIQVAILNANSGWQIWVAGGQYSAPNTASGLTLKSGVSIYGGFPSTGTAKSLADRTAGANITYLSSPYYFGSVISGGGSGGTLLQNLTFDGMEVQQSGTQYGVSLGQANAVTFQNIRFHALTDSTFPAIYASYANFTIESCKFNGFNGNFSIVKASDGDFPVSGMTLTISNSTFDQNTLTQNDVSLEDGRDLWVWGYSKLILKNCHFRDFSPRQRPLTNYVNDAGSVDLSGTDFNSFGSKIMGLDAGNATVNDLGGNVYQ